MLGFCGFCSDIPTAGQYAYETYTQISKNNNKNNTPTASVLAKDSNLENIIKDNPNDIVKKIMKSNYAKLIKQHEQSKEKFTDLNFPPNQKSIGLVKDCEEVFTQATWKRIPQIVRNPQFMNGKIQPLDILHENIGNSYFLSAVAALAQQDYRIKNLFSDLRINPHGIYMARILYQGILQEVVVDDYIPVSPQGTPLYAKPTGGREIWVMILQKCWAKLNGSYEAMVGGYPNEVLHALSGAPTYFNAVTPNKESQNKLWHQMVKANRTGYLVCCATRPDEGMLDKCGLVSGYAYALLSIFQTPYKIVRVRNPWGKRQWNGRASGQDRQFWTSISPVQRQRLGYSSKNDGTFFMLYEDFVNYFFMVDICRLYDNSNYVASKINFSKKNGEIFELVTDGVSLVTIGVSQACLKGIYESESYSRTTIVVAKYEAASKGYEYKYVDSDSTMHFSDHYLELKAPYPGKYIIFVKCHWLKKNPQKTTISIYSASKCSLVHSSQSKHEGFLYKTFLDHARNNNKRNYLIQQPSEWICNSLLIEKCGYGYFVVHLDKNSQRRIGVQLEENQFSEKRLVLKKPYKGKGRIKTSVQPGKQLIILFRLKSHTFPFSLSLPQPKIYNLV